MSQGWTDTGDRARLRAAVGWISTVARLLLGGVLLVAGVLKAVDPQASVAAVRAYELVPTGLETLVGWGLPFVEVALGLLLLAGVATRPAAAASGLLMLVFLVGVVSAAARGLSIDCGCFGGGGTVPPDQTAYGREIARDLGLVLMAGWLVARPQSRWSLERGR